jgi:uridine kinase
MELTRTALLDRLAAAIGALRQDGPTLVAIDGRSAAGKTTLADDLAERLRVEARPVLRSSIDDFHPPGHKFRSMERRYTSQSYYDEGFDYAAFRRCVLDPLRPGGSRRCRLSLWDSYHDVAIPDIWTEAPEDAVLVADGAFLLRPDLRPLWHYAIWLHVDWDTMVERAARRDVAWVGSAEVVVERYRTFWIPTHTLYETAAEPQRAAHLIVDNRRPDAPRLLDRPLA